MSAVLVPQAFERVETDESELLDCLRKIGKGLVASGTAVGVVENTLTEIALNYDVDCEIMALPNAILINLGQATRGRVDLVVQRLTTVQLDQVSELGELVERVKHKKITLVEAARQMDGILVKRPRFNSLMMSGIRSILFRPQCCLPAMTGHY
jgi:uncharacterized membrane protein YjjP (DUF1212 family)